MQVSLETLYLGRFETVLLPLAKRLNDHITSCLAHCKRIDRVSARAKSVERFIAKAMRTENGAPKSSDPLNQIQDQLGARIVTFYLPDVIAIATEVERYFRAIETKLLIPESDSEFGYFGKHYVLFMPEDVLDDRTREHSPRFFELQIKTLFQHAWSEANHDLGYKPPSHLTSDQRRKIAFTAAQAWGADQIFSELHADRGR